MFQSLPNTLYRYFPLLIFVSIWAIILFLYNQQLYNIKDVRPDTLLLTYLSIGALATGYFFMDLFDPDKKRLNKLTVDISNEKQLWIWYSFFTLLMLIGVILTMKGVASFFDGNLAIYYQNPVKVRHIVVNIGHGHFSAPLIFKIGNYLINWGLTASFLGGMLFTQKKYSFFALIIVFVSLLAGVSMFSRYIFINSFGMFAFSYLLFSFLRNKKEQTRIFKKTIYFIILSVALVFGVTYAILSARAFYIDDLTDLFNRLLYFYLVGGLPALDIFIYSDPTQLYGFSSFRSLTDWMIKFGIIPETNLLVAYHPFVKVSTLVEINTYTYIKSFFQDFGLAGVGIMSALWGGITRYSLRALVLKFNIIRLAISAILCFSLFISFFSFYFEGIAMVVFRLIPLIIISPIIFKNFKISHTI